MMELQSPHYTSKSSHHLSVVLNVAYARCPHLEFLAMEFAGRDWQLQIENLKDEVRALKDSECNGSKRSKASIPQAPARLDGLGGVNIFLGRGHVKRVPKLCWGDRCEESVITKGFLSEEPGLQHSTVRVVQLWGRDIPFWLFHEFRRCLRSKRLCVSMCRCGASKKRTCFQGMAAGFTEQLLFRRPLPSPRISSCPTFTGSDFNGCANSIHGRLSRRPWGLQVEVWGRVCGP